MTIDLQFDDNFPQDVAIQITEAVNRFGGTHDQMVAEGTNEHIAAMAILILADAIRENEMGTAH